MRDEAIWLASLTPQENHSAIEAIRRLDDDLDAVGHQAAGGLNDPMREANIAALGG